MNNRQQDIYEKSTRLLIQASHTIGRSLDPETSVINLLHLLCQQLDLSKSRVLLPDECNILRIRYSFGLSEEEQAKGIYAIGEGVTGTVMKTARIALIPNVATEPLFLSRMSEQLHSSNDIIAYLAVPIVQDQKPIGVLAAQRNKPSSTVLQSDVGVLQVIAAMIQQVLRIDTLVQENIKRLRHENSDLREALVNGSQAFDVLGESHAFKRSMKEALRAASSDASVLLSGESGTGKERFSRSIHLNSARRDGPFICINCGAIPPNLLESELFGHEKGSFTGALKTRKGKFELASGGTILLDEIGDMNFELQVKILRVLQEKTIQRIGGNENIDVDVRVIAATHQDLESAVNQNSFRLDLYYRLNVLRIELPALRDRDGDIKLLALFFLNRTNQVYQKNITLTGEAIDGLEKYEWPGNIRQLENVIERIVILADQGEISANMIDNVLQDESNISLSRHFINKLSGDYASTNGFGKMNSRPYVRVDNNQREHIEQALLNARGNKTQAAINLGLTPRQIHYRIKKLGIEA